MATVMPLGTLRVQVNAAGGFSVSINGVSKISGSDTALATGGALATGANIGLYDEHTSAVACAREYRNLSISSSLTSTPAVYTLQDLEFRTNEILRETSAGGVYSVPSLASQPFQPELTPAGSEGLTNRVYVMASRSNPDLASDPMPDAFDCNVWHTPNYLLARNES